MFKSINNALRHDTSWTEECESGGKTRPLQVWSALPKEINLHNSAAHQIVHGSADVICRDCAGP